MLAIIILVLMFAGLRLSDALVLLPLKVLSLLQVPTWLGCMLLVALLAWFLED